jgi:hypothetical protein
MPRDRMNAMEDVVHDPDSFPAPERLGAVRARQPEATGAWLHVVSGPTVPVLSRAVFELAARFLARGERVLVLDAAPRLRLHERFDREARWGVLDSLAQPLPVLGLVQDAGRLGLYLLAHGASAGPADWSQLPRVLDEARPHFGRAVLALDPDAPEVIGQALAGVHLEAWWPQGAREARRTAGIGGRLGIPFADLDLDAMLTPRLETLDARVWALAAPPVPAETEAPAVPTEAPAEVSSEVTTDVPSVAQAASEPVVLDGDAEVRERLRFLLWTRRSGPEGEKVAPAAAIPDEPRAT